MERILRNTLRRTTPAAFLRLTFDSTALFCACTLIWEHLITVQLSEGPSMYPTFSPRGDYLMISRFHKHGRGIEVGDVVRFYHPSFLGVNGAKRVLGLPGDFVCKDEAFGTDVGRAGEMIQVGFLTSHFQWEAVANCFVTRCRKVMLMLAGIIFPGREIRGTMALFRWRL